jgi:peptide deformylase
MLPPLPDGRVRPTVLAPAGVLSSAATAVDPLDPVVVAATRWERGREGCLSVPDLTGDVKRATRLVLRAVLPGSGEQVEISTDAFEARALQHEVDHLDGLLFLDKVAGAHALHARQVYL